MAKKGKITFIDTFEPKVFEGGKLLADSLDPIVVANKRVLDSFLEIKKIILELAKLSKAVKPVKTPPKLKEEKEKLVKVIQLETIAVNESNRALNNLNKTKERNKQASNSTQQALIKERVQLQAKNKVIRDAKREELGLVGAYERLNKQRTIAKTKLANLLSGQKANTKQVKRATLAYQKLNKRVLSVDKITDNYTKKIGNYKSAFSGAISVTRQFASALGAVGGAFAFVSVFKNVFRSIKSFDDSMQNLAGIARVTRGDMADLEQTIIDVSGNSVRTATDVAKLAESLTTLGKTKEEVKALLQPVNDLSLALGSSSDETGEFLVQMLNTFEKSTDSAAEFADTIATIRTSTSLNFQKMRDSFQYLAPISKILNKDLAYTGSLVGILADNGIKAERAGRLLGTAQQRLAKENLSLNDGLELVNEASSRGVKEVELLAIASDIFGKQAAGLGIILSNNSDEIDKNAEAIRNNKGALKDLVDQQLLSLSAHLDILKSKWESYILNTDKATSSNNQLKKGIKFLSDNLEKIVNTIITGIKWFVAYKIVLIALSIRLKLLAASTVSLRIANIALAGGVKNLTRALKLMGLAIRTNPIFLLIGVVAGLYFAYKELTGGLTDAEIAQNKFNNALERTNLIISQNEKNIRTYTKGREQLVTAERSYFEIQEKIEKKLKSEGRSTFVIAEAIKLLTSVRTDDVKKIQLQIDAIGTFSKSSNNLIRNSILGSQSLTKIIKENEDFINKLETEKIKKKKELAKKQSAAAKKLALKLKTDAFNLSRFVLNTEIKLQDELFKNREESDSERLIALSQRSSKEIQLALLTRDRRLQGVKKGTDAEKLILAKFEEEKKRIRLSSEDGSDDFELEKIKRLAEKEKNIREKALNDEISLEKDLLALALQNDKIGADEKKRLIEQSEREIAEIKRKYALEGLNSQLTALNALISQTKTGSDLRIKYEAEAARIKGVISDLELKKFTDNEDEKPEKVKLTQAEITELVLTTSQDLTTALVDLAFALSDGRIQNIDLEIEKNNEYYDNQIELAEGDASKQKLLEEERAKQNEELEKKKRREQRRQAIFDKATTIAQIGLQTALSIIKASPNVAKIAFASVLGALQLATALTTQIPSYFKGTDNHPGGLAEVAEFRPEVVSEPNKKPYVISKRGIYDFPKRTKVTPSISEYNDMLVSNSMTSLRSDEKKLAAFKAKVEYKENILTVQKLEEIKELLSKKKPIHIRTGDVNVSPNWSSREDF